jgi:23S rRNA (adenine2503-C2)-methyltransferase
MTALCDHDLASFTDELRRLGHNADHARMLLRRYYEFDGELPMDRLPVRKSLRAALAHTSRANVLARRVASDGTIKLLLGFAGGASVETVLMPSHRPDRAAGCVSSQVGCAMGCDFCASTTSGLSRNLDAGEIVEQFLHLRRESRLQNRRLATLVFMGMGEPMHNLENVLAATRRIADPAMGALGWRHVALSTVGIVRGIERLIEENLGVQLAVSLHAPDDETRRRLIPAAKRHGVGEILAAARRYQQGSGRVVMIEYCLLADVNDHDEQAVQLAKLLHGWRVAVNLIPHNPIGAGLSGASYQRPSVERVMRFSGLLQDHGVVVHIRRPRGDDVDAACGQLRQQFVEVSIASTGGFPQSGR